MLLGKVTDMSLQMNILGISAYYHDSAACIVRDGNIIAAAQEERFTRKRHDPSFPQHAIEYCLSAAEIDLDKLDYIAFYDKPWIKFERLLETYVAFAPLGFRSFIKAMPLWIKEKLWMGNQIADSLGYKGKLIYTEHHQSHAASAFFPSPFSKAAIITVDGVGEWATTTWGVGNCNKIDLIKELRFPHSLGLLYSAFTYYTGFKVNSGEYKVMGLAPYGENKYVTKILDYLIDLKSDGSFSLNMEYFNYCHGLTMTNKKFHSLFGGEPRKPETRITQREMDLACSIQSVTEEIMLRIARHVRKETGEKNLCLAGGVALNCVANGRILSEGIFDNLWIQPAAGDAGGAIGAALFAWYQVLENSRTSDEKTDRQHGSFLGPEFHSHEIELWLKSRNIPFHSFDIETTLHKAADLLAAGKIIGWFSGRMEFGPRSLGARSILGDARKKEMQKDMNLKIKHRESFRPFAPSCLKEDLGEYFEMTHASPYMLLVAPVCKKRRKLKTAEEEKLFGIDRLNQARSDIPAVTHVDYSARIQTVDTTCGMFRKLLEKFKDLSGSSVLVNTSFNVRGEPIVCTPEDAYRCFMRTEIDILVLENHILYKNEQPNLTESADWRKEFALD